MRRRQLRHGLLQPLLVRAYAAGHLRPGRSGPAGHVREPHQVHGDLHRAERHGLPEFAGSANPHFDAVRAMNHVYQFPAGVTRVSNLPASTSGGVALPVSTGPDATQVNLWATQ
jgi:hypothetical protein